METNEKVEATHYIYKQYRGDEKFYGLIRVEDNEIVRTQMELQDIVVTGATADDPPIFLEDLSVSEINELSPNEFGEVICVRDLEVAGDSLFHTDVEAIEAWNACGGLI